MKTQSYYFTATVENANVKTVRICEAAKHVSDAFAGAATALANKGFQLTAMQRVSADQYYAMHGTVPVWVDDTLAVHVYAPESNRTAY